jgi:hypothetical protein
VRDKHAPYLVRKALVGGRVADIILGKPEFLDLGKPEFLDSGRDI